MKEYVVAGVMKPYNEGDNEVDNFNIKFYNRKELENFIFDLEDMELEDCPPADVVLRSIDKVHGYRFSAGNMDFVVKFNK